MDEKTPLARHSDRVEEFTEKLLRPYIAQIENGRVTREPKEFNDPIWGTIRLSPLEVTILDSPLLQRLRRIRQLGVVHLVYMAATHTRLEHSVGVVHQVQQIADSLNTRANGADKSDLKLSSRLVETLRLAGLCHDVGHGVMSHVSEYALDGNRDCKRIVEEFSEQPGMAGDNQLSEIGAYLALGSPAFKEMLATARATLGLAPLPEQSAMMQKIVVGSRVDEEFVLAQEIISGPFDADKLDYLARDATMCGVPIVTDVTRLIQKVRAARAESGDLPEPLRDHLDQRTGGYVITGVARSGGSTLIELTLARVLMFDKVYRHHAVRAAESMVFHVMSNLAQLSAHPPAFVPYMLTDEQLLDLDFESVCDFIESDPGDLTEGARRRVETIADIVARLRDRRLFVRGFAIAGTMTNDAYKEDPQHSAGLRNFLQKIGNPQGRERATAQICRRVLTILESLGREELLAAFGNSMPAYLQLSPPRPAPKTLGTDADHAFLIDEDGTLTLFTDDAPETAGWSDAFIATHDLGHVFCPKELAPYVYLGTEVELRMEYGIRMPETMLHYTKLAKTTLDEHRRELAGAGFYDKLPGDLKAEPRSFTSGGFDGKVDEAVRKLDNYAGPIVGDQERGSTPRLAAARVKDYIKQYDGDDDFVMMALEAVGSTRQITRQDVWDAVEAFLGTYGEFEGANLCTLGSIKDSSTLFTNFALDSASLHNLRARHLDEALDDSKPIIFVDDFVGLGSQTIDIMQHWLEMPPTQKLNEVRDVLPSAQQDALRAKKLAFVYVAGLDDGAPAIRNFLRDSDLDGVAYTHIRQSALPTLASVFGGKAQLPAFREFCREAGARALVDHNGKPRSEEWRREHALGYGGHELLFTSMFNTPTASLTALWAGSARNGWLPIFPRRDKN